MPRKILVFDTLTQFTVTVPDDAKITFGPAIPFPARNEQSARFQPRDNTYALRIYKGNKDNLLAVFPDVRGFRDEALEIEERPGVEDDDVEMSEVETRQTPAHRTRRRRLVSEPEPDLRRMSEPNIAVQYVPPVQYIPTGQLGGSLPPMNMTMTTNTGTSVETASAPSIFPSGHGNF